MIGGCTWKCGDVGGHNVAVCTVRCSDSGILGSEEAATGNGNRVAGFHNPPHYDWIFREAGGAAFEDDSSIRGNRGRCWCDSDEYGA